MRENLNVAIGTNAALSLATQGYKSLDNLTDNKIDAINTYYIYTFNLNADRDWVKLKNYFEKRATGLNQKV